MFFDEHSHDLCARSSTKKKKKETMERERDREKAEIKNWVCASKNESDPGFTSASIVVLHSRS